MTHAENKWILEPAGWLDQLQASPILAVIRAPSAEQALPLAQVAIQSGLRFIEIALSSPEDRDLISHLRQHYPQQQIGAGSVLTPEQANQVIGAGAQFVVSPFWDPAIVQIGRDCRIPVIPGALTPREIWQAWQGGATAIKVFPIQSLGGVDYLRHLRKPLGSLPLIPTGGITLTNSQVYLQTGAIAVGIGGDLFPQGLLYQQDWSGIQTRLSSWVTSLTSGQDSHISVLE